MDSRVGPRMHLQGRLRRARSAAVLAGKTLGVAATVAALGLLWVALHAAEHEAVTSGPAGEGSPAPRTHRTGAGRP